MHKVCSSNINKNKKAEEGHTSVYLYCSKYCLVKLLYLVKPIVKDNIVFCDLQFKIYHVSEIDLFSLDDRL